jgi:hypothetical protein
MTTARLESTTSQNLTFVQGTFFPETRWLSSLCSICSTLREEDGAVRPPRPTSTTSTAISDRALV